MSAATATTINTEADKRQAILEAVSLISCDGDMTELRLKVERLMSIIDDGVLDYVLNEYALPFKDYKEGCKQIERDTIFGTNKFLHKVGFTSDFTQFCCYCFYIPDDEERINGIPPGIIENKHRLLGNGRSTKEEESN